MVKKDIGWGKRKPTATKKKRDIKCSNPHLAPIAFSKRALIALSVQQSNRRAPAETAKAHQQIYRPNPSRFSH
jgi:hypothetical protein